MSNDFYLNAQNLLLIKGITELSRKHQKSFNSMTLENVIIYEEFFLSTSQVIIFFFLSKISFCINSQSFCKSFYLL